MSSIPSHENFADRLLAAIDAKRSYTCVGLDPRLELLPPKIRASALRRYGQSRRGAAAAILEFNKAVIDVVSGLVPAVKPQVAFYECYGWEGMKAFSQTVQYAKRKGLLVISDAKRGDVGSTAVAYAAAHLGTLAIGGKETACFDADALTVNPYLGTDSIEPFVETANDFGKGLFILCKTSNPSSKEIQDLRVDGTRVYERVARLINTWGKECVGERGYSSVGAVVGATQPRAAKQLRKAMPKGLFLVPGYGAQGAGAADAMPCFDRDGYGAVVNSARAIIFAYTLSPWKQRYGSNRWERATEEAVHKMNSEIEEALRAKGNWPFEGEEAE